MGEKNISFQFPFGGDREVVLGRDQFSFSVFYISSLTSHVLRLTSDRESSPVPSCKSPPSPMYPACNTPVTDRESLAFLLHR